MSGKGGEDATDLIRRACLRERRQQPFVPHADNDAAQTVFTLKAKLKALGITPSHSRPGVSDDNAHIETRFRTYKYVPSYPPDGSAMLEVARD